MSQQNRYFPEVRVGWLVIKEGLRGKEVSHASKGGSSVCLSRGLRGVWLMRGAQRRCSQPQSSSKDKDLNKSGKGVSNDDGYF